MDNPRIRPREQDGRVQQPEERYDSAIGAMGVAILLVLALCLIVLMVAGTAKLLMLMFG